MRRRRILHGRRQPPGRHSPAADAATFVEVEPEQLAQIFAVPQWLRDLGLMSWLVVGGLVLLGGAVWLLSLTAIIVTPVITATIIAAVLSPVVGWLARHRLGRGGGAALVLVLVIALGALIVVLLLGGVTSQAPELKKSLHGAVDTAARLAAGRRREHEQVAGRGRRREQVGQRRLPRAARRASAPGIAALASLAAFLSFTALSLFFLLKDGPLIRAGSSATWASRTSSDTRSRAGRCSRCAATSSASRRWPSSTRWSSAWAR